MSHSAAHDLGLFLRSAMLSFLLTFTILATLAWGDRTPRTTT